MLSVQVPVPSITCAQDTCPHVHALSTHVLHVMNPACFVLDPPRLLRVPRHGGALHVGVALHAVIQNSKTHVME